MLVVCCCCVVFRGESKSLWEIDHRSFQLWETWGQVTAFLATTGKTTRIHHWEIRKSVLMSFFSIRSSIMKRSLASQRVLYKRMHFKRNQMFLLLLKVYQESWAGCKAICHESPGDPSRRPRRRMLSQLELRIFDIEQTKALETRVS